MQMQAVVRSQPWIFVAIIIISLAVSTGVEATICPSETVKCVSGGSCEVTNFRGAWQDKQSCRAARVVYPKCEQGLIRAVAEAVKEGRKIKVMSAGSHTFNRFPCPGGSHGVVIDTRDYNTRIVVNKTDMTVTVDAGVQLKDVIEKLAQHGLAFTQSPYWDSVSMAGIISMAVHGSGLWAKGGLVSDYVVALSLVVPASPSQGFAKLLWIQQGNPDLNAAKISLGVLGAISQIRFAVEKMFKRRVVLDVKRDSGLEATVVRFARKHEFGDVTWYPALGTVVYRADDRVPVSVPGHGLNQQILFSSRTVQALVQGRTIEEKIQADKDASRLCKLSTSQYEQTVESGFGFLNDNQNFSRFPVIGFNNKIQSSSQCQNEQLSWPKSVKACPSNTNVNLSLNDRICGWDSRVKGPFFFHSSIAIPLDKVPEAINDIKRLRHLNPEAFCALDFYGGFLMRTIKKSDAYLGFKEDTVDIEFFYYRSRQPNFPRWNEDVTEEIEQLLLHKYGGRPHWAKNRVYAFDGSAQRAVSLEKFLEVKTRLDPLGFFSSEWSDAVLGTVPWLRVQRFRNGCAHDGLCICSSDHHCSPDHGFFCRPGRVWSKARVCRQE